MRGFPCLSVVEAQFNGDVSAVFGVVGIGEQQDVFAQNIVFCGHTDEACHADGLLQSLDIRGMFLPGFAPIARGVNGSSAATLVAHVEHQFARRQLCHLRFGGIIACR